MKYFSTPINSLSIVMAAGCNLECEYCLSNKSRTNNKEYAHKLQVENKRALQDGTFLKNIVQTLIKSDNDPKQIDRIELWGQEPTLALQYLVDDLENWIHTFPNITHWGFSTNGMTNTQVILDLADKLDELIGHRMEFSLQYSYDGEWSTNNIRHGNADLIKEHALTTAKYFASKQYKNLNIRVMQHNVISFDLLHYLDTDEKILAYEKELSDFVKKLRNTCESGINKHCSSGSGPGIQIPYRAGKEDGIFIANFMKHYIKVIEAAGYDKFSSPLVSVLFQGADIIKRFPQYFEKPLQTLYQLLLDPQKNKELAQGCFYCGAYEGELKIMYDGTLVTCQSMLYDVDDECLDYTPDKFEKAIKKSLIKHKFHSNLLTDSDEDIKRTCYIYDAGKYNNLTYALHQQLSMMIVMAGAGQIDESYTTDKQKLLLHAFVMATKANCQYNNLMYSGTFYMKDSGYTRMYCNGLLDLMLDYYYEFEELRNRRGIR